MFVSLSKRVLDGSMWTFVASLINRSMGIVSSLILIRFLTPEDFGIVALATMVMLLFLSFCELGIRQYIIKTHDISHDEVNCAWSLQLCINLVVGLLLIMCAPLAAKLLSNSQLIDVLRVIGFIPIIAAFNNPGVILRAKHLDFKMQSKVDVYLKVVTAPVTIYIAVKYQTYWALVIGQVLFVSLTCLSSYKFFEYRPKFNYHHFARILSSTKWLLASTITGFMRAKAENVIVNSQFGAEGVGLYDTSKEFACLPQSDIIAPASAPILSGVSSIRTGIKDVYIALLKHMYVSFFFLIPSIFGTFLVGDLFVQLIMGEQWLSVIPVFKIVSILMPVLSLYTFCRTIMLLTDDLKIVAMADIGSIIIMFLVLTLPFVDTLETLAIGRVGIGLIFVATLLSITLYKNKLDPLPIINLVIMLCILSLPFSLAVYFVRNVISDISPWIQLILSVTTGGLVYFLTLLIVRKSLSKINVYYLFTLELVENIFSRLPIINRAK
jgi:lipopolysaccharide exporter